MSASPAESVPEAPLAAWRAYLRSGQFMLQRCGACERFVFQPRVLCPFCSSQALSWQAAGERGGTVYSATVVNRREKDGGPYNVVLVDLAEGVRMMSRVEGVVPESVHIGQRVMPSIGTIDGEPALLFSPA
jgi:hypothetical protein